MKITCPSCSSEENIYSPIKCIKCSKTLSPPMTKVEKFFGVIVVIILVGIGIFSEKAINYFKGINLTQEDITTIYTATQNCMEGMRAMYISKGFNDPKIEEISLHSCSNEVKANL